jgi:2-polyprenyl-6-methoxyphenol hydroxylase-like FAD-dependent oxidoreductase
MANNMIYQPLLEQIGREGIKRFDHVQLRCGHRVANIEQHQYIYVSLSF